MVSASTDASTPETLSSPDMADIIARVVHRHGVGVLNDRRRTLGLLRDYAPTQKRGVSLLMAALDHGAAQRLATDDGQPAAIRIEREARSIVAGSGLQFDLAHWAAETWSAGLHGGASAVFAAAIPTDAAASGIPLAPDARPRSNAAPAPTSQPEAMADVALTARARHGALFWIYQILLHILAALGFMLAAAVIFLK